MINPNPSAKPNTFVGTRKSWEAEGRKRTSRDSGASEIIRNSWAEAKGKAMDVYSWVRRSLSRSKRTTLPAGEKSKECLKNDGEEHQLYGVTEALIEFIKSFSVETFRNFSLPGKITCNYILLFVYSTVSNWVGLYRWRESCFRG